MFADMILDRLLSNRQLFGTSSQLLLQSLACLLRLSKQYTAFTKAFALRLNAFLQVVVLRDPRLKQTRGFRLLCRCRFQRLTLLMDALLIGRQTLLGLPQLNHGIVQNAGTLADRAPFL